MQSNEGMNRQSIAFDAGRLKRPDVNLRLAGLFPGTEPISGAAGFDFDSGLGLVNAERALRRVADSR